MKKIKVISLVVVSVVCLLLVTACAQISQIDPIYRSQDEWAQRFKDLNSQPYQPNKEITGDYDKAFAAKCSNGTFVGKVLDNDVKTWKGIPFADIPARFERSVAPANSDKVYEAYHYGKSSLQTSKDKPDIPGYEQGDLDCLSLAVYTVNNNIKNKPVMVYVHGGGWQMGATCWKGINPQNLVHYNPDIVVIDVTYRVGITGQINLGSMAKDAKGNEAGYLLSDYEANKDKYKTSCNNGMLDIIQGLRWVKQNAKAFGGDSSKITVAGESAGASAVSNLLLMDSDPSNQYLRHDENLFQQAIVFSGGFNLQWNPKRSESVVRKLAQDFGAKTIKDLQNIDFTQLQQWWWQFDNNMIGNFCIADGEVLPADPHKIFQNKVGSNVRVLYGANTNEFQLFQEFWKDYINDKKQKSFDDVIKGCYKLSTGPTAVDPSFQASPEFIAAHDEYMNALDKLGYKTLDEKIDAFVDDYTLQGIVYYMASEQAKNGGLVYTFAWDQPFDGPLASLKASHGSDMNYLFGNFDGAQYAGTKEEVDLSIKWQHMICNFVKSGNPSADGVNWKPYDLKTKNCLYVKAGDIKNVEQYQSKRIEYLIKMYESGNKHYCFMAPYVDMFSAGGICTENEFYH